MSKKLKERAHEVLAALPDTIRVGPFDFSIEFIRDGEAEDRAVFAECHTGSQRILLRPDMPTPAKAVDSFLHECCHAIWWAYTVRPKDDEERIVGAFGTALTALFRDNPWLTGWVREALDPPRPPTERCKSRSAPF